MYTFARNREPFCRRRYIPLGAQVGRQRPLRRMAFSASPGQRHSVLSALADEDDWDVIYDFEAPQSSFSPRPWYSPRVLNPAFHQTNHESEFRRPRNQRRDSSPFESESRTFSRHHHSHEHHHHQHQHPRSFRVHDDERYIYNPAGSHLPIPVVFLSQPCSRSRGGQQDHHQSMPFDAVMPMSATISDLYDIITRGWDMGVFVATGNNEFIPLEEFRTVGDLEDIALGLVVVNAGDIYD